MQPTPSLLMRYFTVLLLLFAVSFSLLPACAQKAVTTQKVKAKKLSKKEAARQAHAQAIKAKNEAGAVLTFERTPCMGRCPAYVMQIFADGRVAYEGRGAVPVLGAKELKLPVATVAEILHTAREAHFEQFEDRYSQGTSDLPSTVITIRQPNGQLKRVVVEEGAPLNVVKFVTYLTNQFDTLAQLQADR
ncbi:DUF6438 domain-containing protein [Hymenobacter humi]|uniref:DUF6438 domain-containing protein n=1 Tax=Hymenobacter humi TaxID=1411620 RepID=A0ABW2U6H3_9BACT